MLNIDRLKVSRAKQSFTFQGIAKPEQIILIRGKSGIGKSTLLETIAGFLPISSGTLEWQGKDISTLFPHERPLSLLLQGDNLFPHLTLLDNVCLAANPSWKISKATKGDAHQALAEVGLKGFEDQYPNDVSGGQAQRAGLARALLGHRLRPKPILLLDEPYSALDDENTEHIHQLIQKLCKTEKLCVLLVAHRKLSADQVWTL